MPSTPSSKITLRPAQLQDMPGIASIANHYVDNSVATFRLSHVSAETMEETYSSVISQGLPYIVAVSPSSSNNSDAPGNREGEQVVGYTYASGYRQPSHMAYQHTVELSIFVHPSHYSHGIGSKMLTELLSLLRDNKQREVKEVLAVMSIDTHGSDSGYGVVKWYTRWGFREVGKLQHVGHKFGRWIDTVLMQLSF